MVVNSLINNSIQVDLDKNSRTEKKEESTTMSKINVTVNGYTFIATLEDNKATREFVDMMENGPVVIEFEDYAGIEKVGDLGKRLTGIDRQITTSPGDIVLYSNHYIVVFYGNNSWNYTKIGKIDDLKNYKKALGSGDVTIEFSLIK